MPVVLNVILEALITVLLLLQAHRALLTSPTPNRQVGEARLTWGQSHAAQGSGVVHRLGSKRRREELAKELSGLLVWGAYLAIRSWADAALSWFIPFYGSFKTLWLLWVLVNNHVATWLPYRYALQPVLQRHEAAIDTGIYWAHGILVYLGHLGVCAALSLTPQIAVRFYDRCRRLYEDWQPRQPCEGHPLGDKVSSPKSRTQARTPRPTPRLPGALSLTPKSKLDTRKAERNASITSTPTRLSEHESKRAPAELPTLVGPAQKPACQEHLETPIERAGASSESPHSDGRRKRGKAPDTPSKRMRGNDLIDTPSKRGRRQQAPLDEKPAPAPQVTRVGNVSARTRGADSSEQAAQQATRVSQARSRTNSRRPTPPSQLPRAKRAQTATIAERSKARRVEQDARPARADAANASQGRTSATALRTASTRQPGREAGAASRTRSQSRRTVN